MSCIASERDDGGADALAAAGNEITAGWHVRESSRRADAGDG
jgi:hypothetical protein